MYKTLGKPQVNQKQNTKYITHFLLTASSHNHTHTKVLEQNTQTTRLSFSLFFVSTLDFQVFE
jgi:hypothetical protein